MTPRRFVELVRELGGKVRLDAAGRVQIGGSTRLLALMGARLATLDRAALKAYLVQEREQQAEPRFTCPTCSRHFFNADSGSPCWWCRRPITTAVAGTSRTPPRYEPVRF